MHDTWTYRGGAGELSSVKDGLNRLTSFAYDNASRLGYITFANAVGDDLTYDGASQLIARQAGAGSYINDAMCYHAAGRNLRANQSAVNSVQADSWYGPWAPWLEPRARPRRIMAARRPRNFQPYGHCRLLEVPYRLGRAVNAR